MFYYVVVLLSSFFIPSVFFWCFFTCLCNGLLALFVVLVCYGGFCLVLLFCYVAMGRPEQGGQQVTRARGATGDQSKRGQQVTRARVQQVTRAREATGDQSKGGNR